VSFPERLKSKTPFNYFPMVERQLPHLVRRAVLPGRGTWVAGVSICHAVGARDMTNRM